MALTVYGQKPLSVFRLNGASENSGTYALGWVMESSLEYRNAVIERVFGRSFDVQDCVITLQKFDSDRGFTDLEIRGGLDFHVIFEAKLGWNIPGVDQLDRYSRRLLQGNAEHKRLVSVSSADRDFALRKLPRQIGGVPINHLSWRELRTLATQTRVRVGSFEEKLWLRHLSEHLREFSTMERHIDNNVFVVSLGGMPINEGSSYTWIDVVTREQRYFHPVGGNWPVEPPNYIGFRYHGKLQAVHHVDGFEIVDDLQAQNPSWPLIDRDHFLYRLGLPMRPAKEIRTGNIYRHGRVWCAIDTLLSGEFSTISDARDETQRRLAE